jgi:hypothetical protein
MKNLLSAILWVCVVLIVRIPLDAQTLPTTRPATVRVAVVGTVNELEFWKAVADRFESKTGIQVDTKAAKNHEEAARLCRARGIDLYTSGQADTIINWVADGYALDPQPWVRELGTTDSVTPPVVFTLAVTNPEKFQGVHLVEARRLAAFLRTEETQHWIDDWRQTATDTLQRFHSIKGFAAVSLPNGIALRVTGLKPAQLDLDQAGLDKLPHISIKVTDKDGTKIEYSGVLLSEVLKLAGAPLGGHQLRGVWANATVHVRAADGYTAAFALADFDDEIDDRGILLADHKDGQPLAATEGPWRIVVPGDKRQARWVRMVRVIEVR